MASFFYNRAAKEIWAGNINIDTDTLKVMLVNSGYTPNRDDDFVDTGGTDALSAEIVATGYAGGWTGAGRKTVSITITEQDANDRAVGILIDLTWTALGGAANDTIAGAILIKEGGADDTDSELIVYWDLSDTATNGGDIALTMDATNGNLRVTT